MHFLNLYQLENELKFVEKIINNKRGSSIDYRLDKYDGDREYYQNYYTFLLKEINFKVKLLRDINK